MMSAEDKAGIIKLATFVGLILAVLAVGWFALFIVLPAFVVAVIVDRVMGARYNRLLRDYQADSGKSVSQPRLSSFDAQYRNGVVMIGWMIDLPDGTELEIYRTRERPGSVSQGLPADAELLHATRLEFTSTREELLVDDEIDEGVAYYFPVVRGTHVERTPIAYSFLSFSARLEFTSRKLPIDHRGSVVRVVIEPEPVVAQLPDGRDEATRLADDIKSAITDRRAREEALDEAIARIRSDDDLTEREKEEAIELLETRMGVQ